MFHFGKTRERDPKRSQAYGKIAIAAAATRRKIGDLKATLAELDPTDEDGREILDSLIRVEESLWKALLSDAKEMLGQGRVDPIMAANSKQIAMEYMDEMRKEHQRKDKAEAV